MRMKDAVASLQLGRKKQTERRELCTIWSGQAPDGPGTVPLPEYPRPQLAREEWVCLNGWWEYGLCPNAESAEAAYGAPFGKILVPFSPESVRSGVGHTLQPGETLWYRKKIGNISVEKGRRLILHFGAVDERCTVWWNRKRVGSHRNGYLPFSFDVTEYVKPGENELIVYVRDDTDAGTACRGKQTLQPGGMYYTAQSGIWQTVWLETVPECYIRDLRIRPLPEEKSVELEIRFAGGPLPEMPVKATVGELLSQSGQAGAGQDCVHETFSLPDPKPAGNSGGSRLKAKIPISRMRLWSPEDPFLYSLRIEAGEDKVRSYFGMRSFSTGKDENGVPRLLLNGRPYFFNGILDQGYWPETLMTPPADEAMIYDITKMKEAGFNMLRKHVKIEPARWYYHCDRIGMAVWQDMVNGGGPVRKLLETYLPTILPAVGRAVRDSHYTLFARDDAKARKRFEADLVRMVRQLYNCPCIAMWVPFNEGWGQFDALRITELIKKADPDRPVDHASGWFDQGGGDVRSVHNYFRPLTVEKDDRAFVISEYGGMNCQIAEHSMSGEVYGYQTVSEEEFAGKFKELMDRIRSLEGEGLCGAVYTQVSDIEEETNGLLTYDRKVNKLGIENAARK